MKTQRPSLDVKEPAPAPTTMTLTKSTSGEGCTSSARYGDISEWFEAARVVKEAKEKTR